MFLERDCGETMDFFGLCGSALANELFCCCTVSLIVSVIEEIPLVLVSPISSDPVNVYF